MKFRKLHSGSEVNIFTEIARLASTHNAVNLSQGSPDYDMDPRLKNFLKNALDKDVNQHASSAVIPELAENLINFGLRKKFPLVVNEKQLTVCPGATYSIYVALAAFLEAGDEVIVFEPCYETYAPAIEIRKARTVYVSLDEKFDIDWDLLKDSVTPKTKAVIVNSPHNPTGRIWSREDWGRLWEIIKDREIVVISDEVYDLIHYDHWENLSAFHHPEIRNRCFCIFSFEKMFHITGWKSSFVLASEEYTRALNSVHQYLTFTINIFAQHALADYLQVFDPAVNAQLFEEKRNLMDALFADLPIQSVGKAQGGYFQTFDFSQFRPELSDFEFTKWLIEEYKVAGIPYSSFYHDRKNTGKIRFCFAKQDGTISAAAENLRLLSKKAPLL